MKVAVLAAAALAAAPNAQAAMCIRWESAASARPGERVTITFRTVAPVVDREWMPYVVKAYPFRVSVTSPRGQTRPVLVGGRPADPEVWEGSFVPGAEGLWAVRIANFGEAAAPPSECYRALLVSVSRAGDDSSPWLLAAGAGALALLLTAWQLARRRGSARAT